jgi:hypothetical protein
MEICASYPYLLLLSHDEYGDGLREYYYIFDLNKKKDL